MKTVATLFIAAALAVAGVQADATVRLCKDQNLGACTDLFLPGSGCTNFPGPYNDKVSSLDTYGNTCTFFVNGACGGSQYGPLRGAFATVPGEFNDKLSSVHC